MGLVLQRWGKKEKPLRSEAAFLFWNTARSLPGQRCPGKLRVTDAYTCTIQLCTSAPSPDRMASRAAPTRFENALGPTSGSS